MFLESKTVELKNNRGDVITSVSYTTKEVESSAKEIISLLKSKNITYYQAVKILEQARSMLDFVTI